MIVTNEEMHIDDESCAVGGSLQLDESNAAQFYLCQHCSKIFHREKYKKFQMHELWHVVGKPYLCKACKKSFVTVGGLKHHEEMIHTHEKTYSCEICKKCFNHIDFLKQHETTHVSDRYCCEIC